ncbi:MAG: hypothetical protein H6622_02600 [Halobacteriovoraceae bacterium]|nr:hypothetical protein [Halobacteriovoraceae bacterium]
MTKLALIGKNISHSKSQQIYENILKRKIDYTLLDYSSEELIPSAKDLFQKYDGISITAPYKKHFLSEVSVVDEIRDLNAINCLYVDNSKIYGTNTDYLAVDSILDEYILKLGKFNVVILGDGPMSYITQKLLDQKGLKYLVFSRKKTSNFFELDLSRLELESKKTLVINTCAREYEYKGKFLPETYFWDYNYDFLPHLQTIPSIVVEYTDGMSLLERQGQHALVYWGIS